MKNLILSVALLVFAAFIMTVNHAKAQTLTVTPTVTPVTSTTITPTPTTSVPSGAPQTGYGGM